MTRIAAEARATPNSHIWQEKPGPWLGNMTAFLKIDECKVCERAIPWEWVPAVLLNGKPLSGTGVWRSQRAEGLCPVCVDGRDVHKAAGGFLSGSLRISLPVSG